MNTPPLPLASSSLSALRLLVGYALTADEAAPARPTLLAHAGATGTRPCQALVTVLGALRRRVAVAGVFDGILAATLGREAEPFANETAPELARRWRERGDSLDGRELAALLWQVARRQEPAFRAIEFEIARACPPPRLLSPEQRALEPIHDATRSGDGSRSERARR